LIALSAWCIVRDQLAIAGIILAVATVKPQMVVLPLVWFLLWGVSAWDRRWPLLAGFGGTLIALSGAGELILPGWPRYFVEGLLAYRKYAQGSSLLSLVGGKHIGIAFSVIVMAGLLALAWRNRRADAVSQEFVRTLAAFLIGATVVLPLLPPFNQVLLLLPTVMIVRDWATLPRVGRRILVVIIAWPWLCSLLLLWLHPHLDSQTRLPLLPSATVLVVPFLLLLLSFTRRNPANDVQHPGTDLPLL
jgi:hypothetical protein